MHTRVTTILAAMFIVGCSSGGDSAGGELGRCAGYGRIGGASSCTINLSCVKGKYELVCEPTEGGATVTTCQCLTADKPGKSVEFDPAYCADQGSQEHGAWLKGLARQADDVCGWNADF